MNNLINMSEYEKIIFVNGIDESQNIETLSKNYPFVVFFANSDSPDQNWTNGITNIWKNGIRLTKFVGIDYNNCSIEINGHTVKLGFNYKTGLLSLYEDKDDSFIYVGYEYPTDDIVNDENNIIRFSENEIGTKDFWDWRENNNNVEDNKFFYIAIPARYEGYITPQCELYVKNNSLIKFVNVTEYWFTSEHTTLNNFEFIVYKSKTKGIFHGKIQ